MKKLFAILILSLFAVAAIAQQKVIDNFDAVSTNPKWTISIEGSASQLKVTDNTADKKEGNASLDIKAKIGAYHPWGSYAQLLWADTAAVDLSSGDSLSLWVKVLTPPKHPEYMSISNFGNKMKLDGNATTVLHDVDPNTTGNNEKIPANLSTDEWALPLIYRVGVAYSFNFGTIHKFSMAVDALHPSDNYESINVGAEYAFNDFLFLRGGYKGLFLDDSEEKYTFGFGVKQQLLQNVGIMVDYAYCDFGRLKNVQKFSVSVSF